MPLTPGTRIGVFEITGTLGAGGMGEVYRATDTNLDRQVAIKVLPDTVAGDAERLARFDREAKTLAALNHPNIAQIYGLEKTDGQTALVMELVEGPTLADRIAQGPIPVDEALPIARQIAEALEAAHEQGIIHRDLKPANIKLRPDGTVKVLDFGLAKAMEPAAGASSSVSMSPTITTPAMTQAGLILGTAAYMSPEQARGKPVDKRADIWAFGCVLYEMLTGKPAFEAEDVSLTLAEVMKSEPAWDALPVLPPPVEPFLRQCFQKDPRERAQSIGDVRVALEGGFGQGARTGIDSGYVTAPRWRRVGALVGAAAAGIILALGLGQVLRPGAEPPLVARFSYDFTDLDTETLVQSLRAPNIAISPDGTRLAFVTRQGIRIRELGRPGTVLLPNTPGVATPVFSPDGQALAFESPGGVATVSVAGGAPVLAAALTEQPLGLSWPLDDTLLFALPEGIVRVSPGGRGDVQVLVAAGEGEIIDRPQLLPDENLILFSTTRTEGPRRWELAQVVLQSLVSDERTVLVEGGHSASILPTGHLVYVQGDELFGARVNLTSREVVGLPVSLVDGIQEESAVGGLSPRAAYAYSERGVLAYEADNQRGVARGRLLDVDRLGNAVPLTDELRSYLRVRMSPDGTRVVAQVRRERGGNELWIIDVETGLGRLFTFTDDNTTMPNWTPDGEAVVYIRSGGDVVRQRMDGGEEVLLNNVAAGFGAGTFATDVSRDGIVILTPSDDFGGRDIWMLDTRDGNVSPLLVTPADESMGRLSPDGNRLAYVSDERGVRNVYVRPFPDGSPSLVSDAGGTEPVWSRDGSELYYRNPDGMLMMVPSQSDTGFVAGRPVELFSLEPYSKNDNVPTYDVNPDGGFVMAEDTAAGSRAEIDIVLNWFSELEELLPTE